MGKITLDEVVNKFLEATSENISDYRLKDALKSQIINDIKEEVVNKEVESITEKSNYKIREKENKEMLEKLKNIIIETLIIGLVLGLLVNQITELIGIWKSGNQIEIFNWIWVIALLVVLGGLTMLMYISKLSDFINNNKGD